MISTREKYGDDADGNRGIWVWEHEIEESDRNKIVDQIRTFIEENDIEEADAPKTCKIMLSSNNEDDDEEIEFEVELRDYI